MDTGEMKAEKLFASAKGIKESQRGKQFEIKDKGKRSLLKPQKQQRTV